MSTEAQRACYEGTNVPRGEHYPLHESYEPEIMSVIEHFVRPGDFVIDAGASIGFFTCLLSNVVGSLGVVWAFEPDEESFGHLKRNIALRAIPGNVRAFRTALWAFDLPQLRLWLGKEMGYTSVCHYHNSPGSLVVEARTLDTLVPGPVRPRFLKIDCELAEFPILRGAERVLHAGVDCVVVEFNYNLMRQNGVSDHQIRNFMADLGYEMFLIGINAEGGGYEPPILVGPRVEIEIRGSGHHMNVMFSTEEKVRSQWKI